MYEGVQVYISKFNGGLTSSKYTDMSRNSPNDPS
jgi:hypothetical protein